MLMVTCCSGLSLVYRSSWSGMLVWLGFCSSESESWLSYEQGMGLTSTFTFILVVLIEVAIIRD